MKKYFTRHVFLFVLIAGLSQPLVAQNTSWKGTVSDSWSTVANWTNGIPDSNKNAILGDANFTGSFQPKVNINAICKSITIGGATATSLNITKELKVYGNFTIQANATVLHQATYVNVKGNWMNDGSYVANTTGSITVLNGTAQVIGGSSSTAFRRLTVNATSSVSLSGNISVTGASSMLTVYGVIDPGSPGYTITSEGAIRIYGNGKLKVNAATFTGNYLFTGIVTMFSGAIIEYSSTVTNQVVSSAYAYSVLIISGSGIKSLAANLPALVSNNSATGKIIVSGGTFDLGTYTANRGTSVAGGTLSIASGASIRMAGANNFPLNFSTRSLAANSTAEYYGVNQTISAQAYGNLVISGSGIKTAATAFSVAGDLTIQGGALNTNATAVTHTVSGNFIMTGGSLTGTNSTYLLNGSANQQLQLLSNLIKLSVNKPAGHVVLGSDITVNTTLTFIKGLIQTDTYAVNIASSGSVTGAGTSTGWVNGYLRRNIPTGASITRSFEIGNTTDYTPASVTFANVAVSGTLTGSITANDHPELAYSGIDSAKSVNQVWNFTNSGTSFSTASVTLNWNTPDVDAGANSGSFKAGVFNASSWTLPSISTLTPASLQATGLTAFGEFAVGEKVQIIKWTGNDFSSDWFAPKNWFGGVPASDAAVLIPNGIGGGRVYPVLTSGTGKLNDLTIESAAGLTVSNGTLQVAGMVINSGQFIAGNGTIEYNGSTAQTISDAVFTNNSIKNLIISNDVSLAGTDTITGMLTIADGKTFTTNDNLVLKSGPSGTASVGALPTDGSDNATAYITGAVSIERYIPARKAWRLLATPVKAASAGTINAAWQEGSFGNSLAPNPAPGYGVHITGGTLANGFDQSPTNVASIKYYNNTTNSFNALPSTPGTMIPITNYSGYLLYIRGDRSIDLMQGVNAAITSTTLRMKGEINTGKQVFSVNAANYTVLGNPYPSAINFETLTRSNVKNTFYVWDPQLGGTNGLGAYVTVSWNSGTSQYDITAAASPVSQYIPSGEAVLIESADGLNPGTITIKESDKTTNGSDQLFGRRNPAAKSIRVNLFNPGNAVILDGAIATFFENHSNDVDRDDAKKLNGTAESIAFSRTGQLLAIERRKTITSNDTCFINMSQMKKQAYKLEIIGENMAQPGMIALLKDHYAAANNDLPLNLNGTNTVDFSINNDPASYAAGRFSIVFVARPSVAVSTSRSEKHTEPEAIVQVKAEKASIVVYPNPVVSKTVQFRLNDAAYGKYSLQLFNAMGQVVTSNKINYTEYDTVIDFNVEGSFPPGKYELKVEGMGKKYVTSVLKK